MRDLLMHILIVLGAVGVCLLLFLLLCWVLWLICKDPDMHDGWGP